MDPSRAHGLLREASAAAQGTNWDSLPCCRFLCSAQGRPCFTLAQGDLQSHPPPPREPPGAEGGLAGRVPVCTQGSPARACRHGTSVLRSLSWFRSWKSSVEVSRMVLRVWTMVEANLRSSSRSRMSAIEWKMFSAFSRRHSCLESGQSEGYGTPWASLWTPPRSPHPEDTCFSWGRCGDRGALFTAGLAPRLPKHSPWPSDSGAPDYSSLTLPQGDSSQRAAGPGSHPHIHGALCHQLLRLLHVCSPVLSPRYP